MPFITQGKSNIKYLLIVFLVAAIASGIIFTALSHYQREIVSLNNFTKIKNIESGIAGQNQINKMKDEQLKHLLEKYCASYKDSYEGEILKLGNYYYFNLEGTNDGIVGLCQHSGWIGRNTNNAALFVLDNKLKEIFKYTDHDLGNVGSDSSPFMDIKILDINNNNKNEIAFYCDYCGGTNAGCTYEIYLLYPESKEFYHIFRHTVQAGPDEKVWTENFYSKNLESTEHKKIKDYLENLMDEWYISMYGNESGF